MAYCELGITEIGCMAHARRRFFDLHIANKNQLAEHALHSIDGLYEVELHANEMSDADRWRLRYETAVPIAEKLHERVLAQLEYAPEGSATAGQSFGLHPLTPGSADALPG